MLKLRPNVSLFNLQPQGHLILQVVSAVFLEELGRSIDCEVTSGSDGSHMPGSYHAQGLAFDFSLRPVIEPPKTRLAAAIARAFGGSGAEVLIPAAAVVVDPTPPGHPAGSVTRQPGPTRAYAAGDFDVLIEDLGGPNEHLHVEWDGKRAAARAGKVWEPKA